MENIIKELIINNSKGQLTAEEIKEDSSLIEEFGFDSLQMIQLIIDIEEHFDFMFDEEDLFVEGLSTFGSFMRLVEKAI
ncbi:acyl carrier protein [Psychrobacillus sp. L4]|uniref:acyl carrier protein n=1 Tax=Psychrobacillus sp. L4 TaxID=3236892 RepID=UPI0036F33982